MADSIGRVHFVGDAWVQASVSIGDRLPEGPYATPVLRAALLDALRRDCAAGPPLDAAAATTPSATAAATTGQPTAAVGGPEGSSSAAPEATIPGWGLPRWGPPGWTSERWGAHGVWLEPFDITKVEETLAALFAHYHRMDARAGRDGAEGAGSRLPHPQFSGTQDAGASQAACPQMGPARAELRRSACGRAQRAWLRSTVTRTLSPALH